MARPFFQRPYGTLRAPLAPSIQSELTANPLQQAEKSLKASQLQVPKPKVPRGIPAQRKANPFFGE